MRVYAGAQGDGGSRCFEAVVTDVVTDVSHSVCMVGTELRYSARALHCLCIYLSRYGALDSPRTHCLDQTGLELTKICLPFHPKSWD